MKKCKNNIFSIFSEKYGKMSKKVKNDRNGSDIYETGKKYYFLIISEKFGKMLKKLKNDKNGSDIDEKGHN